MENLNQTVTLAGWVQKVRNLGAMTFIDLRDRYGITQLVVEEHSSAELLETASHLGREYVIRATGRVVERASKNAKIPTGEIEVVLESLDVLNASLTPPFTIEDQSDGGDELRMKYRFLDLRRNPLRNALMLRHRMAHEIRNFLDSRGFLEIETPYLIKSTPEGARDFIVPSRMNPGEFYALPQSPQTFKQLLMVAGYDRYFQIVRCFRDEDLAGRPSARVHSDRLRDVVRRPRGHPERIRGSGQVPVPDDSGQGVHRSLPPHRMDRGYGKVWLGQARPALRHDVQRSERRGPGQRIRRIRLGRVYRSDLRRGLRRIHAQAARRPDRIRQTSSDRSQGLGLRALRSGRQLSVERRPSSTDRRTWPGGPPDAEPSRATCC